jgi:hypothetical protein
MLFDLLPDFFKHFFIGIWIELLTNVNYWETDAEFYLRSLVFKFNIQQSAFGSLHKNVPVKRPKTIFLKQPVAKSSTEATKQVGKMRQKSTVKETKR